MHTSTHLTTDPTMHPTLIHIGSIPIRSFGLMVLLGFVLALFYAMSAARRKLMEAEGSRQLAPGSRQDAGSTHQAQNTTHTPAQTPAQSHPHPSTQPITPDHVFDMS